MLSKTYLCIQILFLAWLFSGCVNQPNSAADITSITVLCYHGIGDDSNNAFTVNENNFEEQIRYLSEKSYNTISLDDYKDFLTKGKKLPPRPILFTFDDGHKEHFEKVFLILKKYNFVGTLFVITSKINKDLSPKFKELVRNGFSFGSHTVNHTSLVRAEREILEKELVESKKNLERMIGRKVDFIAYPYGFFDEQVIKSVNAAGYIGAFTTIPGKNNKETLPFEQRRIIITKEIDLESFQKLLEGDKELYTKIYQSDIMQYIEMGMFRPAEIELQELLNISPENAFAKKLLKHIESVKKMHETK